MTMPNLAEFDVQSDLSDVDAAGIIGVQDKITFNYAYWRRPDGWITLGAYWPVELMRQLSLGWQPLVTSYGEFNEREIKGDRFRRLFRLGGAKEFPLDQLMENGWHRNAPKSGGVAVVFPQMQTDEYKALKAEEVKCKYCRRVMLDLARLSTHEQVAHKDVSQQASLARALGDVMTDNRAAQAGAAAPPASNDPLISLLTKLVERVEALEKRPPSRN